MEFKPKAATTERQDPEPAAAREQPRRRPRKKAPPQKVNRSFNARRLLGALKLVGRVCLLLVTIAVLVGCFMWAYNSDQFAVRTVTVNGCKHLNTGAVERIVRREFPKNILRIDLEELRNRLRREGWVKDAEVRRILPSELVVDVIERVPSVVVELEDLMVADSEGVLLDRYDGQYGKLDVPVFKGLLGADFPGYRAHARENAARVRLGLKMLGELAEGSESFAHEISEVDLSDPGDVTVLLVNDTAEIRMGDRDFLKRFRRLLSNMDRYRELRSQYGGVMTVDLRFDGQIIYRPRRESGAYAANAGAAKR
jgi:hypothetical protein